MKCNRVVTARVMGVSQRPGVSVRFMCSYFIRWDPRNSACMSKQRATQH